MTYYYIEGGDYEIYRFRNVFTRNLFVQRNWRHHFTDLSRKRLSLIKKTCELDRLEWRPVFDGVDRLVIR